MWHQAQSGQFTIVSSDLVRIGDSGQASASTADRMVETLFRSLLLTRKGRGILGPGRIACSLGRSRHSFVPKGLD